MIFYKVTPEAAIVINELNNSHRNQKLIICDCGHGPMVNDVTNDEVWKEWFPVLSTLDTMDIEIEDEFI